MWYYIIFTVTCIIMGIGTWKFLSDDHNTIVYLRAQNMDLRRKLYRRRCAYCGTIRNEKVVQCASCGAPYK